MRILKPLITLVFIFFISSSWAQTNEKVIQSIRDRYYRINGGEVTLEKYSYEELQISEENNKVVIIKEPTADGTFEYYFDGNFKSHIPYFIYFNTNQPSYKPYLRAYLDESGQMVWMKKNEEEVELGMYSNPYHYLILKGVNAYRRLQNRHVKIDPQVAQIKSYVESVHNMTKRIDTVEYKLVEEEGYYQEWDFNYYLGNNQLVMNRKGNSGEHGSAQYIYYYKNGELVCAYSEDSMWVGSYDNITIDITYYFEGKAYRQDRYKSYGAGIESVKDENNPAWFDYSKLYPEIIMK